jgi:hypothetical protein
MHLARLRVDAEPQLVCIFQEHSIGLDLQVTKMLDAFDSFLGRI